MNQLMHQDPLDAGGGELLEAGQHLLGRPDDVRRMKIREVRVRVTLMASHSMSSVARRRTSFSSVPTIVFVRRERRTVAGSRPIASQAAEIRSMRCFDCSGSR